MANWFECVNVLLDFIIGALMCTMWILSITDLNTSLIKQSLKQYPMDSFTVDNYSLTNKHILYYWKGMKNSKNCECDITDSEYGCLKYDCLSPGPDMFYFNLTTWKNTTFVSQRSTNYNYYTLLKQAKPQDVPCDKGYKQCGLLDLLNQKLCLLENETCPLNQIEISNSQTPSDIFTNKSAVITTPLNGGLTYLHTSNAEIHSHVIIDIVLGPKSFCMNADERKLGPPYYKYDSSSSFGQCTNIDYHHVSIDEQSKYEVFNENGMMTQIQEFWNDYPQEKLNNYNLHLYKHNYVGFDLTCLGNQEFNEESTKYVKKNNVVITFINSILGALLPLFSLIKIIMFLYELREKQARSDFFKWNRDIENNNQPYKYVGEHYVFLFIFIAESISFVLSLNAINYIFKCAEFELIKNFHYLEKEFIIQIVTFVVCYLKFMVNLVVAAVINPKETVFDTCLKIYEDCQKRKEKKELAKLGYTNESD